MSNQITVLNSSIRQLDNLYSLNDLHLASGNDPKHRPSLFIHLETTKDLISEISKDVRSTDLIFKTLRGRNIQGIRLRRTRFSLRNVDQSKISFSGIASLFSNAQRAKPTATNRLART